MGIISLLRNAIFNPYWGAVGTPPFLHSYPFINGSSNRPLALQYIARLEALHKLGILKGRVLYPCIGNDLFPAYFGEVLGINAYTGMGIHRSCHPVLLERSTFAELVLSQALGERRCQLTLFSATIFRENDYVPKIQASGQIDVLYLKGLKHWLDFYSSFPGGGTEFSRYKDHAAFVAELDRCARNFIRSMAEKLLKPGGFVVIADKEDLEYAGFIIDALGFTDYLGGLDRSPEKDLLLSGTSGSECFLGGPNDSVSISLGEVPIRVLQKPS